ncbi:MAG: hypothetical protein AAF533_23380 [Acidobacteriota bacterium]
MTRRVDLLLELESEAILTATSGTEGGHQTLRHVPGACLLGAAAGRLYGDLFERGLKDDAFTIFHSGQVRFLPGLPASPAGERSLPAPLSLHHRKGESWHHEGDIDTSRLWNLAAGDRPDAQLEQLRDEFITLSGRRVRPRERTSLRSSTLHLTRGARRGVSRETLLFAYEAVPAGTTFHAAVEADDAVDEALFERAVKALCQRPISVGRNRSAEHGRARVRRLEAWRPPEPAALENGLVHLLCLSELALVTPEGQPTLEPRAAHFGLPVECELEAQRTFLRERRYSPFNAKRRRPDLERCVLTPGSVITFRVPTGVDVDLTAVVDRLRGGVGRHRQDGLGQVLVQPSFLGQRTLVLDAEAPSLKREEKPAPVSDLLDWLHAQADVRSRHEKADRLARDWEERLAPFTPRRGGPTRAQWGTLRQLAAMTAEGELTKKVFGPKSWFDEGVRKECWNARYRGSSAKAELQALQSELGSAEGLLGITVQMIASRVAKALSKGRAGERA